MISATLLPILVILLMAGPYGPGRPKKNKPTSAPGEYRWRDKETGEIDRIGETNNLSRRRSEYPTEKVPCSPATHDYETMEADGRSTSKTRRAHEAESIEKHDPQYNQRAGGGGRRPASERRTEEAD